MRSLYQLISYTVLATLTVIHIYTSEPPIVVACSFDVISKNAETGNLVADAIKSAAYIVPYLSWRSLFSLSATSHHMQQRGIEIAKTTPGITNTIKRLLAELEEQGYGKFNGAAIACFNEMGVNPIPDEKAVSLLKTIKSFKIPTIGMGNQDSAEHTIYTSKMLDGHDLRVSELFDGIVTIPTLEEQTAFELGQGDCFLRNAQNPRWLVARDTCPSDSFSQTIKMLAHDIAGNAPLWAVARKEQLAIIVNALQRVSAQRTPSPESTRMFEAIMEQNRAISPTKV
jgi:hypothetical protein